MIKYKVYESEESLSQQPDSGPVQDCTLIKDNNDCDYVSCDLSESICHRFIDELKTADEAAKNSHVRLTMIKELMEERQDLVRGLTAHQETLMVTAEKAKLKQEQKRKTQRWLIIWFTSLVVVTTIFIVLCSLSM